MKDCIVYQSQKSKVFQRVDNQGRVYAVKVLNFEFPRPSDIDKFLNEFEILKLLAATGARQAVQKTRENGRHVLILDWIEGQPLKKVFHGKSGDIADILYIAISIAEALAQVHENQIIHQDISPHNIIVDLQARQASLIDFGNATRLGYRRPYSSDLGKIDSPLAYISPEQTGRMNRQIDHRSDLYSFGVTLYEMLAGEVPFNNPDPLELIHSHLARIPPPLAQHNPHIPPGLSAIVNRLLAKNADDRYQSARGVLYDLKRCLNLWEKQGFTTRVFSLGSQDYTGAFHLPQKLYGREDDLRQMVSAFEDCAAGNQRLLLVGGPSGTGKTTLVHEIHKPVTHRKGDFCSGKFDQNHRATPYFAVFQAFRELLDMRLALSENQLNTLRCDLLKSLGDEAGVLVDVLPKLEHIIGPQPDVPALGGAEAQNRFHYVFRKFARTLCSAEHPVVLFIDDLQWADSASLELLKNLLSDPEIKHLLTICAYRENEVDLTHPFMRMIDELGTLGQHAATIDIGPLSQQNLTSLLSDALHADAAHVTPLAELVHRKTGGNAFFATSFIQSLAKDGLLRFDRVTSRWHWQIDEIAQKNIADNVVSLMVGKLQKLEGDALQFLKTAACIGNRFDLLVVGQIAECDRQVVITALQPALAEGLIIGLGQDQFKFSHDRVQQAVTSLISEDALEQTHLRAGRNLQATDNGTQIFDVANHLNAARNLIHGDDAIDLARLNLEAGQQAHHNAAFPTSLEYFATGISLLNGTPAPWDAQYQLCLDLHKGATEAAYLSGDFNQMHIWFQEILSRSDSILEKLKPYEIRILAYKAENNFDAAIDTGLELLAALDEQFPETPHMGHVLRDLVKTDLALRRYSDADLMDLPLMTDPRKQAAMRIMADIMSSVYWGRPKLVPILAFRMVQLTLRYGNHPVSCFAFGSYGVLMCGVLGAMRRGNRFGQLALDLLDKLDAKEWKAQIYVTAYTLIFHWNRHVRTTQRPLQQSFQIGMETGAVEFACVNTNIYCIQAFLCGVPLDQIARETEAYSAQYLQLGQETNYNYNQVFHQAMLNLKGHSDDPLKLTGTVYNEDEMLAQNTDRSDKTGTFFIHFNKLVLATFFRQFHEGQKHAAKARDLLDAVLAKFEIPNHHFYEALTLIALAGNATGTKRWHLIRKARRNNAKLKRWAKSAPENYRHKYDLCRAELARIRGRKNTARLAYDRAISGATTYEFLHEQALACELAGRFYVAENNSILAEFHLKAAYNTYREWGASAKLAQLAASFPKYLSRDDTARQSMPTHAASIMDVPALDIATILKASTSISREVAPASLLRVLMKIVLENAGAQRGFFLMENQGALKVQAHGEDSGEVIHVLQDLPLEQCETLSVPLVQFVHRTSEAVIISDAEHDTRVPRSDTHMPRSVLCIPILNKGDRVGVLYLENNVTSDAFTRERVDLLSLLSGQIAVSIDNAMLHQKLEQKVRERTVELAQEKQKSDELLLNILPAETADELKQTGHAKARFYENVTVIFTDFQGFTEHSSHLSPDDLVQEINVCFRAFDEICETHKIEKIKTIGDAFMAVGGLPVPNSTHAEDVMKAALKMRDFIAQRNTAGNGAGLGLRIGIHSGPVVAGVVGSKKFQYDIWGDTVNVAARMEAAGKPGKINISRSTRDLIAERFHCVSRGKIAVKGKGPVQMYLADRLPSTNTPMSEDKMQV